MKVLVAFGSKHGATQGIAEAVAKTLSERGFKADVLDVNDVHEVQKYDAFVVGSAVYAGHWVKEAKEFLSDNRAILTGKPVWLFSSGPLGDPLKPDEEPVDSAPMIELSGARGHVVFAGALDKKNLGFGERAVVAAFRAPEGDFRDWDAIQTWANQVADDLSAA